MAEETLKNAATSGGDGTAPVNAGQGSPEKELEAAVTGKETGGNTQTVEENTYADYPSFDGDGSDDNDPEAAEFEGEENAAIRARLARAKKKHEQAIEKMREEYETRIQTLEGKQAKNGTSDLDIDSLTDQQLDQVAKTNPQLADLVAAYKHQRQLSEFDQRVEEKIKSFRDEQVKQETFVKRRQTYETRLQTDFPQIFTPEGRVDEKHPVIKLAEKIWNEDESLQASPGGRYMAIATADTYLRNVKKQQDEGKAKQAQAAKRSFVESNTRRRVGGQFANTAGGYSVDDPVVQNLARVAGVKPEEILKQGA